MNGQPQQSNTLYEACFRSTLRRRTRYLNKTCFVIAVFASIILRIPHGRFWWNLVESLYRAPLIFMALLLVQEARSRTLVVEYSAAKSLAQHILSNTVLSHHFYAVFAALLLSACLLFLVYLSQTSLLGNYYVLAKEFRVRPAVNDAWVYFWFHGGFCAWMYALQHMAFQRNRLPLSHSVAHVTPETTLFAKKAFLVGNALFFTAFCALMGPLAYAVTRLVVYRVCWPLFAAARLDPTMPPMRIGFSTLTSTSYVSFVAFLLWEFACHVYDTYLAIGCVDGQKTISARSPDPLATVISGLRDVRPEHAWMRATAFQELAYVASANNEFCKTTRDALFNGTAHRHTAWPGILAECSLVIRDTSSRVNFRSASDMAALRSAEYLARDEANAPETAMPIFGNSHDTTTNDTTQFAVSATSSPLKAGSAFEPPKQTGIAATWAKTGLREQFFSRVWEPLNHYARSLYGPTTTRQKEQLQARSAAWKAQAALLYATFLASKIGVLFRTTAKRDAESRVRSPALFANAVLALSGLLAHAVEEDRSGTVTNNHVSEVLNVLERPIRSCANYIDVLPASVFISLAQKSQGQLNAHLVAEMHDVAMREFFQLCVKYNYKLNDLLLSPRAFKLAKWVIDVFIAQQQRKEKTQMEKYL